jgi:hypothetical protein
MFGSSKMTHTHTHTSPQIFTEKYLKEEESFITLAIFVTQFTSSSLSLSLSL